MKIYVHKNGKSFGPYSESQLRDCLVAKKFSMEDPACYNGKPWIRFDTNEELVSEMIDQIQLSLTTTETEVEFSSRILEIIQ